MMAHRTRSSLCWSAVTNRMRRKPSRGNTRERCNRRNTMRALEIVVLTLLARMAAAAPPAPMHLQGAQGAREGGCSDVRACRQLAEAAAERGEYERFHDLAWRAVQTGSPRDPASMLLLARAQSLSGRPHDALVMLGRLADMGVNSDAATNP